MKLQQLLKPIFSLSYLFLFTYYCGFLNLLFAQEDEEAILMDSIAVEGVLEPPVVIDPTKTRTSFGLEEIESRQAGNIFEIIDDIPGVSLSGGPRGNGIDLNIRGFGNNEDVIIKIDGAIKNFEKYRFGGTFIEPELLKRIDVTRGAATITSGSGALGGVVEMETKDASDFLKPGQKFGINTKTGFRFNNDEQLYSVTMFAAPTSKLDLLLNITDREANDFDLTGSIQADGNNSLSISNSVPSSGLAKAEYYLNDDTTIGLSFSRFVQSGIEPFDAQAPGVSFFGSVDRDSDDKTYASKFLYDPVSELIDIKATLAFSDIQVSDVALSDSFLPEGTSTDFEYDIWALELKNNSIIDFGNIESVITFGIDGEYSKRVTDRVIPSLPIQQPFFSQPSGIYQQYGVFLVNEINFNNFTITPGLRWDYNHSRVTLDETVESLRANNQDNSESFDILLPNFSASYKFGNSPFTVFYNYWEQYRPPKIDEYFTQGGFGAFIRCPTGTNTNVGVEPFATTGICGELFEPEESTNHDIGLLVQKNGLFGNDSLLAKVTYFNTKVENLLETLNNDINNRTAQTGKEDRDGYEIELNYARENVSLNLAYSEINGDIDALFRNQDTIPVIASSANPNFNAPTKTSIPNYTIPGDTLTLTTKYAVPKYKLELGWRAQYVDERLGLAPDDVSNDLVETKFDSYLLHDIWVNWKPFNNKQFSNTTLRFGIDNVTNKRHRTNNDTGLGNFGVARNVKLTFSLDF